MMYKIQQKKFWVFQKQAEIVPEKQVVRTTIKRFFKTEGYEVPFSDIKPEETTSKHIPVMRILLSIVFTFLGAVILGGYSYLIFLAYTKNTGFEITEDIIKTTSIGVLSFTLGAYYLITSLANSCQISIFTKQSNGHAFIILFSSGRFAKNYNEFKSTLLTELKKATEQNFFLEVIRRSDTDFLVNTFRHEVMKELQSRGVNIKEFVQFISELYAKEKKDNIVRLER